MSKANLDHRFFEAIIHRQRLPRLGFAKKTSHKGSSNRVAMARFLT
ncbi:hypothetical protein [Rubripirellula amarantea]|nr:hypothetical protein [Rubripirellula amarantea]